MTNKEADNQQIRDAAINSFIKITSECDLTVEELIDLMQSVRFIFETFPRES